MIIQILLLISLLVFAIVCHEYAHGWAAFRLGDPTAKMMGRLTLNPIKHIDPLGTIILPGILIALSMLGYPSVIFGWAKPVPVNFMRLRNPKRNMKWVALAGPAVNIILALVLSGLYHLNVLPQLKEIWLNGIFLNLLLAIFNMVPIPPLDGSRVVMSYLPDSLARHYAKLERYGLLIVGVLLYFGLFKKIVFPVILWAGQLLGVSFL